MSTIIVMLALLITPTKAEEAKTMGLTFEGGSERFITYEQTSAYEAMAPGEERIQKIKLTNEDYREMKFYIRCDYIDPLGEGTSNERIAYEIAFSNKGEKFYSGKIGGMNKANMTSTNQNYLLQTLKQGETAEIDMSIKIDGDSMDNSYQNSEGRLNLIFSVEYEEPTPIEKVVTIIKEVPILNQIPGVNTGDPTMVSVLLGAFCASIIGLLVLVILRYRSRKEEGHETKI